MVWVPLGLTLPGGMATVPVPLQCCPFMPYSADRGPECSLLLVLWEEEPTKAQAAEDSTLIGYLAHPWLTGSQF